jgi:hypothetical protein
MSTSLTLVVPSNFAAGGLRAMVAAAALHHPVEKPFIKFYCNCCPWSCGRASASVRGRAPAPPADVARRPAQPRHRRGRLRDPFAHQPPPAEHQAGRGPSRRATSLIDMPGCIVSAAAASFRSVENRRRRATPEMTSTFENVSDIGVCPGLCPRPSGYRRCPVETGCTSRRAGCSIAIRSTHPEPNRQRIIMRRAQRAQRLLTKLDRLPGSAHR